MCLSSCSAGCIIGAQVRVARAVVNLLACVTLTIISGMCKKLEYQLCLDEVHNWLSTLMGLIEVWNQVSRMHLLST